MLYNLTRLVFLINSYWYLFSQTFIYFLFFSSSNWKTTLLLIFCVLGSYFAYSILLSSMNRVIQRVGFEARPGPRILPVSLLYLSWLVQGKFRLLLIFPYVRAVVLKLFAIIYILANLFNVWLIEDSCILMCFFYSIVAEYCFSWSILRKSASQIKK